MTTTTPWSDTPPSDLQPGEYIWFRFRGGEPYPVVYSGEIGDSDEFGPRVLTPEETVALTAEVERLRAESRILNQRYDLLEQENDGLRRNGVVIYVGSEELQQLRAENAALRALIENNNAVAEMCGLDLPKSL